MTRLSRGDGERDRFQIAHLTDHDYVRIFPQCAAQCGRERARMRVHLALGDVAGLGHQNVFDRVFEGDDVLVALRVYLIYQCRQRCRLAAADRAGHENQTILITRENFQMLGQAELVHRAHFGVDDAEDKIDTEPLPHHARAEPPE